MSFQYWQQAAPRQKAALSTWNTATMAKPWALAVIDERFTVHQTYAQCY